MLHDYSINERIKILRVSKGYSQEKIAELLGLKVSSYSQMERKGIITVATAKKIANFFGVSYEYLLDGNETEKHKININAKEISELIKQQLDNHYNNRYCFLDCYSDTEITALRVIFCLNKKQRTAVYQYANKIYNKEIVIDNPPKKQCY